MLFCVNMSIDFSLECQIARSLTFEHQSNVKSLIEFLSVNSNHNGIILKRSHRLCLLQSLKTLQLTNTQWDDSIQKAIESDRNFGLDNYHDQICKWLHEFMTQFGSYTLMTPADNLSYGIDAHQYDQCRGLACFSLDGISIHPRLNPIMVQLDCSWWAIQADYLKIRGQLPEPEFKAKLIEKLDEMELPGQLAYESIRYCQDVVEI